MEFEDVLMGVGDYGKYQRNLIVIFLVPAASLLPWLSMNVLFMVSVPDHWCSVPELSAFNLTIEQQRSLISPPNEHCRRYNISYTDILHIENSTLSNASMTPCDQGWQYDETYWDETASTKWNMVCDDSHYNSFILTMQNVGSMIGTPIYGSLSDKYGRKFIFFITIIITAITAISSVLQHDFTAFVILKTINGSLMPSVFQLPFIIILEIIAPELRARTNGIVNISWTVGLCILPLLAYFSRSWVTLGLVTSSVTIIFLFYYTFLPESPRWLASQERYEEAAAILYQIGEKNGKTKEKNVLVQTLQKLGERFKKEKTVDKVKNSSLDLLRYPQLRKKFIIITFCWMANIMSYYGLQFNISNLAGNEFVNFFLLGVAEVPGYLSSWIIMERFGRRWCSVAGFLCTGVVCMLPAIEFPHNDIISSMLGKYFAALTFMTTYQQSSELYPTVVRSLGMGMSCTLAMLITLVVPYIVYLSIYGKAIPFIIIGLFGILAGILASFLPETLNENLPQSISDAEKFGLDQKFFSWNWRRHSIGRERAASLKLSMKAMDTIGEDTAEEAKSKTQVLQNVEFPPGSETTCVSVDSVNVLNGGSSIRKRNSVDGHSRESNPLNATPAMRRSISDDRQSEESRQNPEDKSDMSIRNQGAENDKEDPSNKAPAHTGENLKFSYANVDNDGAKTDDGNGLKLGMEMLVSDKQRFTKIHV
ncbi:organic cation transporter 1 [Caerostris darwini]|uniref:Organic cation transporter 1 n=1 Tax=Caerostris darwini TaxID=1538125 RepID=A0AAV4S502_9ARAC|nr:organic cation transporter 1 [Caerostris darwini]